MAEIYLGASPEFAKRPRLGCGSEAEEHPEHASGRRWNWNSLTSSTETGSLHVQGHLPAAVLAFSSWPGSLLVLLFVNSSLNPRLHCLALLGGPDGQITGPPRAAVSVSRTVNGPLLPHTPR